MSWSRKDIIADIEKHKKDWNASGFTIDTLLPYPELKSRYCQIKYSIAFHGSGIREVGIQSARKTPPDTEVSKK